MKTKSILILKYFMLAIFFASMSHGNSLEGQERNSSSDAKNQKAYGGFGYFMLGYQGLDFSDMNSSFVNQGYPEIPTGSLTIGGGGHYIFKNWLIGGEGFGLLGGLVENDNCSISSGGGYGFFDLGYLAWKTPSFYLYPILGIGGGGYTVNLKEKDLQTSSYPDILNDSGRETNLENGGFMLNFSILANYMIAGAKEETYSSGLVLGVKAGYILNLDGNNWYQNNEKLEQSPNSGMSGPYVSIVIGGGGLELK